MPNRRTTRKTTQSNPPSGISENPKICVGVDAHIDPAVRTIFTEIFGEFETSLGAMCSIAPYT